MKLTKKMTALTIAAAFGMNAHAGDAIESASDDHTATTSMTSEFTGAAKDAWLDGKLEATYMVNRGLSAFDIDTRVNNGEVILTGVVESDAHRQLAEQIAMATDGITAVDNQLTVRTDAPTRNSDEPTFGDKVEDATIAALLKSKLLINGDVSGTDINVDVSNGEATLRGTVETRTEAELAEYLARNTEGVREVHNKLEVSS